MYIIIYTCIMFAIIKMHILFIHVKFICSIFKKNDPIKVANKFRNYLICLKHLKPFESCASEPKFTCVYLIVISAQLNCCYGVD